MVTQAELAGLLVSVGRRDEAAFEALYAATRARLFGVVLRIVRHQDLAEEIVQEAYVTHPAVREACANSIVLHARTLETDIEAAIARSDYSGELTAESLALHTQAVVQGAFILAKALDGMPAALDSLDHLARYFRLLFAVPARRARKTISKEK